MKSMRKEKCMNSGRVNRNETSNPSTLLSKVFGKHYYIVLLKKM